MEPESKKVVIGLTDLTEGEGGNILLGNYDRVTRHDEQHVSQICENKRFIKKLDELRKKYL
jgi:hypothetical protein